MLDRRLIVMSLVAAFAGLLFMTVGARGNWDFILTFRGTKLLALVVVATSISVATVLFQTVSGNRILTPSIMGFDSLYLLLQTLLVFLLGGVGFAVLNPQLKFGIEVLLLCLAAMVLFGTLLGKGQRDLYRMLLVGVVFGILFRSLTSLLQRLIDPSDFTVVQSVMFARFNHVDSSLLWIGSIICVLAVTVAWRLRFRLDVLALGRDHAISLGLNYRFELFRVLCLVAVLVSTSTALVGPVTFFGLLVTALAHRILHSHRHTLLLTGSAFIATIVLVGGQVVFERLLGFAATLSVAVEFLGGLVFLFLILRRPAG